MKFMGFTDFETVTPISQAKVRFIVKFHLVCRDAGCGLMRVYLSKRESSRNVIIEKIDIVMKKLMWSKMEQAIKLLNELIKEESFQ